MVEKPLITIVTVTYNCKDALEKTISSVINQTYPYKEYIIIDGGSKDGTVDVIRKHESSLSLFISEPDKGIYDAMNKGIIHAHGEWIIFMNAGDSFYSNEVLSHFIPKINNKTIIAYGDSMIWLKEVHYIRPKFPIDCLKTKMCIPHQSTLVRLDYHKEHLFDISFRSSGDFDFFHKAYVNDAVEFQYIPVIISNFDGETGISKDNFEIVWREDRIILGKSISGWRSWIFHIKVVIKLLKNRMKRCFPEDFNRKIKLKNLHKKGINLNDNFL